METKYTKFAHNSQKFPKISKIYNEISKFDTDGTKGISLFQNLEKRNRFRKMLSKFTKFPKIDNEERT